MKAQAGQRGQTFLLNTLFLSLIYVMSPSSSLFRFLENRRFLSTLAGAYETLQERMEAGERTLR